MVKININCLLGENDSKMKILYLVEVQKGPKSPKIELGHIFFIDLGYFILVLFQKY